MYRRRRVVVICRDIKMLFFLMSMVMLSYSGSVLAEEYFTRKCESTTVTSVQNFNFTQLLGKWYGIQRNENNAQKGQCEIITIEKINEAELSIEHLMYLIGDQKNISLKGTIKKENPESSTGELTITYENSTAKNFAVVGMDNQNYAVLWLCLNHNASEIQSKQYLWVWSRNDSLSPNASQEVNTTIASNGLDYIQLTKTNQDKETCWPQTTNTTTSTNTTVPGNATSSTNTTNPTSTTSSTTVFVMNSTAHGTSASSLILPRGVNCLSITVLFSVFLLSISYL